MIARIKQYLAARRNPGRDLANIGHQQRKQTYREKAQEMRRQMGMSEDPRLA